METKIPEGYQENSKGGFDPISMIKEVDLDRDRLVMNIVEKAIKASEDLRVLKQGFFDDISTFVTKSAKKYGVKFGGEKGNMQFVSYNGRYKVLLAVNETITFDERLQIAKELIDQCIKDWSSSSRDEIKVLIDDAFYIGKSGTLNTARILGLRRLDIKDKRWVKAMNAISDSVKTANSKEYVRVYRRNDRGEYDLVNLDVASI